MWFGFLLMLLLSTVFFVAAAFPSVPVLAGMYWWSLRTHHRGRPIWLDRVKVAVAGLMWLAIAALIAIYARPW